jgi:hypothetical protein
MNGNQKRVRDLRAGDKIRDSAGVVYPVIRLEKTAGLSKLWVTIVIGEQLHDTILEQIDRELLFRNGAWEPVE